MWYAARFENGLFVVEDRTEMQPNIVKTCRLTADADTFAPFSLDINFDAGERSQNVDLTWDGGQVPGAYAIDDGSGDGPRVVEIERDTGKALARGSLFALTTTLPLEYGVVYGTA